MCKQESATGQRSELFPQLVREIMRKDTESSWREPARLQRLTKRCQERADGGSVPESGRNHKGST